MRRSRILVLLTLVSLALALWAGPVVWLRSVAAEPSPTESPSPRRAQQTRLDNLWRQVYQEIPSLPRENQYVRRDSGKVDPDNTLIRRLVDYHFYTRGRTPNTRLDWKLTLADYLGVNELIALESYPGHETLTVNPLARDREAIAALTLAQRAQLVDTLVRLINPAAFTNLPQAQPQNRPAGTAAPPPTGPPPAGPVARPPQSPTPASTQPVLQPLPGTGAADLLKPRR